MAKPASPLDLIRWDEGAPRFDARDQSGLTGWWDHYKESRLFFLVCAQPKVEQTDYITRVALHPFIENMIADIPKSWKTALPHDIHWDSFHTSQVRAVMERRRMGLIKALQAAIVIEHYLASCGVDTTTYYDDIYIRPATYRVLEDDARFTPGSTEDAARSLAAIGQPAPHHILTEHKGGEHICFASAQAIAQANERARIDYARRPGDRGATKPACNSLLYQCV